MVGEVGVDPATLLRPAGDDGMKVWPVSKQVNSSEEQWGQVDGGGWVQKKSPDGLPD
jgi:hypothetical protein